MSVEEERIAMELFLFTRKARVFALVTCAVLACGCQSSVHSPIAPSFTSVPAPTESTSSLVMPGDEFTVQDAPVSYPLDEAMRNGSPSGYTGTCTVSSTHAGGIRVRVDGHGVANDLIELNVVDMTDSDHLRTTEVITVNQQGAFRTNWSRIETGYFPAGNTLQCQLNQDSNLLASSTSTFSAP
jgi:hypothetical protein